MLSKLSFLLRNKDWITHKLFFTCQVWVFGVKVSDGSRVQFHLCLRLRVVRPGSGQQAEQQRAHSHARPQTGALHGPEWRELWHLSAQYRYTSQLKVLAQINHLDSLAPFYVLHSACIYVICCRPAFNIDFVRT